MSLNYKYADVAEQFHGNPFAPDEQHPVLNLLIWATMIIGINQITEKTEKEFYSRICAFRGIDPLFGVLEYNDTDYKITKFDIHNHIGLRTNATPITKAQYAKKIMEAATHQGTTNQTCSAHDMVARRHEVFVAQEKHKKAK
jgi:hypothetical protein